MSSTALWAGDFGDQYHQRNADASRDRWPFWRDFYARYPVESVLEVGCGNGANLIWAVAPKRAGVDVNAGAILAAQTRAPGALLMVVPATHLPFPDASYDLVFTAGVLIHQGPADLPFVMDEMWRVSSRYLLVIEYHDTDEVEVPYRGQRDALWRRPYRRLFEERYALEHLETWMLTREVGFDDCAAYLWAKR